MTFLQEKNEKKILRTVRETLSVHRMFSRGDSVLVAVSGGPDSVALTHVLLTLAEEYSLRPAIVHLNHCLRGPDSDRDAEFVNALARQLGVPIYAEKKDVLAFRRSRRLSLEEAGRRIRYDFFDAVAEKYGFNKIALGHHSDDNAELVLINLLRGSGPLGLSGIAPVREGKIVRPLIHLRRSAIIDYLAEKKLPYVTDASNTDPAFMRNKIRHHLIPELQTAYNPKIIETLNRLGEIMRAEDQWFDDALEPVLKQCVSFRADQTISLSLPDFNQLPKAVKRRVIRKAILSVKKDLRRITLLHVDDILHLIEKGRVTGRLNLPDGVLVERNTAELAIVKKNTVRKQKDCRILQTASTDYQYTISAAGTLFIKEADVSMTLCEIDADDLPDFNETGAHVAFFDLDRLLFPLLVRNLRPGDRFSPLGVNGTQKVKKYFINHKIPAAQRKKCPLLLSGGNIIWIAGHRIDNAVKVSPQTRRVLKAELLLA
jgi:tRNA(Ile)-lysidine synthase